MTPASRERLTVDLRGLKATLIEHAREQGVTPSDVARDALVSVLSCTQRAVTPDVPTDKPEDGPRTRVSMRMHRDDARALVGAASRARQPLGAFVAGLLCGIPAITRGEGTRDHVAALVTSNAELAALSRDVRHLSTLLRQGSVRAAQEYRATLDALDGDVRSHLVLAAQVLSDLRPCKGCSEQAGHPPVGTTEATP